MLAIYFTLRQVVLPRHLSPDSFTQWDSALVNSTLERYSTMTNSSLVCLGSLANSFESSQNALLLYFLPGMILEDIAQLERIA